MQFRSGDFTFELCEDWGKELLSFQDEYAVKKVSDVGIGQDGRVYLLNRSSRPIIICDADGNYLDHWEIPDLGRPHEICFDKDGFVYITDDEKHVVYKLDAEGNEVMRLGTPGVCSDTGYEWRDYRTVKRSAGPFNRPTGVSVTDEGDIFISDGYGNARIHRFNAQGELQYSWGEPGFRSGQFFIPHGILVDGDKVYVCDRENGRIQIFDFDGRFITEWTKLHRPSVIKKGPDGLFYVCECKHNDHFEDDAPSRFCIMNGEGEVLARFDSQYTMQPYAKYHGAHGMAVDTDGNVYIGEVGNPLDGYLCVKKYMRVR